MTNLVYPLELQDAGAASDGLEGLARSPNDALSRAAARWRDGPYARYKENQPGIRILRFSIEVKTHDPAIVFLRDDIELTVDQDLFAGLVVLYGQYGWDGIKAMLACLKNHTGYTAGVVHEAVKMLEVLIVRTLLSIETEATSIARTQASKQRAYVDSQMQRFKKDDYWKSWRLQMGDAKEILVKALQEARRQQKAVYALDARVKERIAKDGRTPDVVLARRKRDNYRRLLANYWESRQKAERDKLIAAQEQIGALFAPALAILDDLDDDIHEWLGPVSLRKVKDDAARLRSTRCEVFYEQKIYAALLSMRSQLDNHLTSLSNPGMSSRLFAALDAAGKDHWAAGGVHQIAIDEALRTEGVFERRGRYYQLNRVLGRDAILGQMVARADIDRPGTLYQAVLRQYLLDLDRHLARKRKEDSFYASIWHAVEVATALACLLIAAAAIPFGAGAVAVPAALTSLIGLLTVSTCVVSMVLLAHGLVELVKANAQAGGDVVDELIRTGQLDPDAMIEVGRLVIRQQALFKAVSTDLIKQVALMALQHKLKPLAYALDMQGHLDDMETLGASL